MTTLDLAATYRHNADRKLKQVEYERKLKMYSFPNASKIANKEEIILKEKVFKSTVV